MFLLVPAYPGCPGSKAVKRSLLLLLLYLYYYSTLLSVTVLSVVTAFSVNTLLPFLSYKIGMHECRVTVNVSETLRYLDIISL